MYFFAFKVRVFHGLVTTPFELKKLVLDLAATRPRFRKNDKP